MSGKVLLDTDILSALMRQDRRAVSRAEQYLSAQDRLTISIITRYEILRGLKSRAATSQLASFDELCQSVEVLGLSESIVVKAADIYANLHRRGELVGDADILIAATAIEHGLAIVSNNQSHFGRIPDLMVDNWLS